MNSSVWSNSKEINLNSKMRNNIYKRNLFLNLQFYQKEYFINIAHDKTEICYPILYKIWDQIVKLKFNYNLKFNCKQLKKINKNTSKKIILSILS